MLDLSFMSGCGARHSKPGNSKGFTVAEVMVTVALIGISTSLAIPSYREMIDKRRITQGAEQIAAFINSTQMEAIRSNATITVSYDRDSHKNWCFGAVVGTDACDCDEDDPGESDYCAIDGVQRSISQADQASFEFMHSMGGDGEFTFEPVRGLLVDTGDADDFGIEVHSESRTYKLNIELTAAGQVRVCSKDSDHSVPGFDVCATPVSISSGEESS